MIVVVIVFVFVFVIVIVIVIVKTVAGGRDTSHPALALTAIRALPAARGRQGVGSTAGGSDFNMHQDAPASLPSSANRRVVRERGTVGGTRRGAPRCPLRKMPFS